MGDTFGFQFVEKLLPTHIRKNPLVYTAIMFIIVFFCAVIWYFLRSFMTYQTTFYLCCCEVLSTVGLLPQLFMFHRDKRVSPLLSNFVVFTACNRIIMLTFWAAVPWLSTLSISNRPVQIVSECFNLLILSDFMYYWVRSKVRGEKEIVLGDFGV